MLINIKENVEIKFDKRLELILGLQYCVNKEYDMDFQWITKDENVYYNEFYNLYTKYAVDELKEYVKNGGFDSFSRTIELALSLNDNYQLETNPKIEKIVNSNSNLNLSKINDLLFGFVKDSNYDKFFLKNQEYYNDNISLMKKLIEKDGGLDIDNLINFFDNRSKEFKIILANFSLGSFGIYGINNNVVLCIRCVDGLKKQSHIIPNLYHEYLHSYINPLGEKYFTNVDINKLFNEAENNGLAKCYNTGIILINEYMVRAITIYLIKNKFPFDYIERNIEREKKEGYIYIEQLLLMLEKKYKYINFEDFYKKLIVPFFINLC